MKKYAFALAVGLSFPATVLAECKPIECLEQAITTYKEATQRIESLETRIKELEESTDLSASSKGLIGGFLDACPAGWTQLEDLQGRFLVGVGNNSNKNRENPQDAAAVILDIEPRAFGGVMDQKLNSHKHAFRDGYHAEHSNYGIGKPREQLPANSIGSMATDSDNYVVFYRDTTTGATGTLTPTTVKGTNYPPFYSVYWCQKD